MPARSTRWSGRTAPASPRSSRSSPACTAATPATFRFDGEPSTSPRPRSQGRRHRGDLPGADALPRPLGHREHLHGPPAARAAGAGSTARAMHAEADGALRPARRAHRPATGPPRGLSIADQQIIEIAKAISLDARVLIMDEPTAALTGVEVERLFAVARQPARRGPRRCCSSRTASTRSSRSATRVTVMRDGDYVATEPIAETDRRRARPPDGRPRGRRRCSPSRRAESATSCSRSRA